MKVIPGFSDYAADEDGNLYTRRPLGGHKRCPFGTAVGEFRTLNQNLDASGRYLTVRVGPDGASKRKRVMVHKLIACTFLGSRPPGMVIAHGPLGKLKNSVSNLSYKTPAQNKADELRDGTRYQGDRHHAVVAKEAVMASILERVEAGESMTSLAAEFGISRQLISRKRAASIRSFEASAGMLEGLMMVSVGGQKITAGTLTHNTAG